MRSSTLISAAAFFELSIAGYVLEDDYMTNFYGNFEFFTSPDPTDGFVKYVDEATARQTNLINGSSSAAQWGVDTQNKTPGGRPSVRIVSKKAYDEGLIVVDVAHMPFGCGTWPAFWTVGLDWPAGGEIDIIEGVNDQTNNAMTLHTGPGCQVGSDTSQFSGSLTTGNCDVNAQGQSNNAGCSITHPSQQSYGAGLNANGGGVYATQWTSESISVYFFPRGSVPTDVLGDSPDPSGWGKPAAKFQGGCNIEKMFTAQQIVMDTTFCGQWAGNDAVWKSSSCGTKAATCNDYVRDNPEAFTEAYWEINDLKVYQDNGKAPAAPFPSATPSKSAIMSVSAPISSIKSTLPTVALPSKSIATSVSAPVSSSEMSLPTIASSKPAGTFPPAHTSRVFPSIQPEPIKAPSTPFPINNATISASPTPGSQSSRTRGGPFSGRPSRTVNPQKGAPTGTNGMPGWVWPVSGDDQFDKAPISNQTTTSAPEGTTTPIQSASSFAATHTSIQKVVQLPGAPATSNAAPAPSDNAPAVPFIPAPDGAVQTVYQTVYITVPAAAEATPATDAKMARMARHVREHRHKWTQHHARL